MLYLPNDGMIPQGLARNVQEQIKLITFDFRQTYFGLVGSTVKSWYDQFEGYDRFIDSSWEQQRAVMNMQKTMQRAMINELAGQTKGVGDVLALRLAQGYGINPSRVSSDIDEAVNNILYGSYDSLMCGVRKLGYWSGFSRAITY